MRDMRGFAVRIWKKLVELLLVRFCGGSAAKDENEVVILWDVFREIFDGFGVEVIFFFEELLGARGRIGEHI